MGSILSWFRSHPQQAIVAFSRKTITRSFPFYNFFLWLHVCCFEVLFFHNIGECLCINYNLNIQYIINHYGYLEIGDCKNGIVHIVSNSFVSLFQPASVLRRMGG